MIRRDLVDVYYLATDNAKHCQEKAQKYSLVHKCTSMLLTSQMTELSSAWRVQLTNSCAQQMIRGESILA